MLPSFWKVQDPAVHTPDNVFVVQPGKNKQVSVSDVIHYPLFKRKLEVGKMVDIPLFCRLDDLTIGFLLQQ